MMRNSISYRVGNEDEEKQGPKRQQQFELQVKSGVRRDHGEQIRGKISQGV
jgi:citrate lyase gamma subunit